MGQSNSIQILKRAEKVTPGGVQSAARKFPPKTVWAKAQGAYMWDVDGNRYLDYHGAWGPIILGHNYPYITEKVMGVVDRLDLFGLGTTELEVCLAEQLCRLIPSAEMALLCNTGSAATFHAIRVSRAFTKKSKIIKFQGCFHGWHDYLLRNIISKPEMIGKRDPCSAGMLDEAIDHTLVCRLNDIEDVENICKEHEGEIAAIIIEPLAHNIGCVILTDEFLRGLRNICDENEIILIFDEVVTGFRVGIGGYQAICGVAPDLSTFGKAIANGYPIAAIVGRRDIMEKFNTSDNGDVFFAGTYNGHPIATSAALATIDVLENEPVYDHIFKLGEKMRVGLREIVERLSLPATVVGYGSIFLIYWGSGPFNHYGDLLRLDANKCIAFRRKMIERGFFFVPVHLKRMLFSYSHTVEDMNRTLEAAEDVLMEMKKEI